MWCESCENSWPENTQKNEISAYVLKLIQPKQNKLHYVKIIKGGTTA